jgi:redox-sensing transcriptional repressor
MTGRARIPRPAVQRLSMYLRELECRATAGESTVSSTRLGSACGVTDAQVRKDLGLLGRTGRPGVGYGVHELVRSIRSAIGVHRSWRAALVGAGNIGRALAAYGRFEDEGFVIAAAFDRAPGVVGRRLAGMTVEPMESLPRAIRERGIDIGIIAVPTDAAQGVADVLVEAGVRGILNFAATRLRVTGGVPIVDVDFRAALERLALEVSEQSAGPERAGRQERGGRSSPGSRSRRVP